MDVASEYAKGSEECPHFDFDFLSDLKSSCVYGCHGSPQKTNGQPELRMG
jgi:hypothetical protein